MIRHCVYDCTLWKSIGQRHFSIDFHVWTLTELCLEYYKRKSVVVIVTDLLTRTPDRVCVHKGTWIFTRLLSQSLWTQISKSFERSLLLFEINLFKHYIRCPMLFFWRDSDGWPHKNFQGVFLSVMIIRVTIRICSLWKYFVFISGVNGCSLCIPLFWIIILRVASLYWERTRSRYSATPGETAVANLRIPVQFLLYFLNSGRINTHLVKFF